MGLYTGEGSSLSASSSDENEFADPASYTSASKNGPDRMKEGRRRTDLFAALLKSGGGGVEVVQDIQPKRYEKAIWNAAWSSMCTISRSTVSAVVAPEVLPYTLPVVRRTMLEVLYIARAW